MGYFGEQNHNLHSSPLDSNIMGRLMLFTGSSYTGKKLLGEGGGEAHFPALKSGFLKNSNFGLTRYLVDLAYFWHVVLEWCPKY